MRCETALVTRTQSGRCGYELSLNEVFLNILTRNINPMDFETQGQIILDRSVPTLDHNSELQVLAEPWVTSSVLRATWENPSLAHLIRTRYIDIIKYDPATGLYSTEQTYPNIT
jgi:hypothetical protein